MLSSTTIFLKPVPPAPPSQSSGLPGMSHSKIPVKDSQANEPITRADFNQVVVVVNHHTTQLNHIIAALDENRKTLHQIAGLLNQGAPGSEMVVTPLGVTVPGGNLVTNLAAEIEAA